MLESYFCCSFRKTRSYSLHDKGDDDGEDDCSGNTNENDRMDNDVYGDDDNDDYNDERLKWRVKTGKVLTISKGFVWKYVHVSGPVIHFADT